MPNTLAEKDGDDKYSKVQHVSFWTLEAKSFSKYGNSNYNSYIFKYVELILHKHKRVNHNDVEHTFFQLKNP